MTLPHTKLDKNKRYDINKRVTREYDPISGNSFLRSMNPTSGGGQFSVQLLLPMTLFSLLLFSLWILTPNAHGIFLENELIISDHVHPAALLMPKQVAATEKGDVYVVWVDKDKIYFASSHNNQTHFATKILLSDANNLASFPQIAATEKGDVYVVWVDKDKASGDTDIDFVSSNDSGKTFSNKKKLLEDDLLSFSPQIAATEKGDVYVVWVDKDKASGDTDIDFVSSNDRGNTFNLRNKLVSYDALSFSPQVTATEKGDVYVVWVDKDKASGDTDIFHISSNDRAKSFNLRNQLVDNNLLSFSPQIAATEKGDVYVVWVDKNDTSGDTDVTMRISHDSGINFQIWKNPIFNDLLSFSPQVAATEKGNVYMTWVEKNISNGTTDILTSISNDSGINFNKKISLNIGQNKYYKYTLGLTAQNVNQLHSKVYFYDSNLERINYFDTKGVEKSEDYIFDGRDGIFNETITRILSFPENASFVKLQMLVRQNPTKNSSYILHDAKIVPITLGKTITWTNEHTDTQSISTGANNLTGGINSIKVDVLQGNSTDWKIISTDYISVNDFVSTYFSAHIAATENDGLYVIWVDKDVQLKQILNNGNTIGETITLSNRTKLSLSPQVVATEKGDVYVLWMGKNNTTDDEVLLFKRISKMRS